MDAYVLYTAYHMLWQKEIYITGRILKNFGFSCIISVSMAPSSLILVVPVHLFYHINSLSWLQETFQWNGITSKRKGQKWGTEKFSLAEMYEHQNFDLDQPNISSTTEVEIPVHDPIDFDKLHPLANLPKVSSFIPYIFM